MAQIDLSKYGITGATEVLYNPSYEVLFAEETKPGLEGFEVGQVTELGAVNVMTGVYTGRSPKDKFFVMDEVSKNTVWWTSDEYKNDNHPCSEETWAVLKEIAQKETLSAAEILWGETPNWNQEQYQLKKQAEKEEQKRLEEEKAAKTRQLKEEKEAAASPFSHSCNNNSPCACSSYALRGHPSDSKQLQ